MYLDVERDGTDKDYGSTDQTSASLHLLFMPWAVLSSLNTNVFKMWVLFHCFVCPFQNNDFHISKSDISLCCSSNSLFHTVPVIHCSIVFQQSIVPFFSNCDCVIQQAPVF